MIAVSPQFHLHHSRRSQANKMAAQRSKNVLGEEKHFSSLISKTRTIIAVFQLDALRKPEIASWRHLRKSKHRALSKRRITVKNVIF